MDLKLGIQMHTSYLKIFVVQQILIELKLKKFNKKGFSHKRKGYQYIPNNLYDGNGRPSAAIPAKRWTSIPDNA